MGFTKPIEHILLSYQGTFIVFKRYYTRRFKMEKVYKVLKNAGGANITVGVLLIVIGITLGIINIVSGASLLRNRRNILF